MQAQSYKIGVVGLWHLGEVYAAGLAELGHQVIGFDPDTAVIAKLQKGIPPIAEAKLNTLLQSNFQNGRLLFTNVISALKDREVIWITFDTPIDENDAPDTSIIFDTIKVLIPHLRNDVLIIISSQLPVGTTKKLHDIIRKEKPNLAFDFAYVPENLQLGQALESFFKPARIVIGAENAKAHERVEHIFKGVETQFLRMSWASAEMAKHALNAFLAASISFINDIADICEVTGADITDVIKALKSDPRVGPRSYLGAGIGFAGGTLGRDLNALLHAASTNNLSLPVIQAVRDKNQNRRNVVKQRLSKLLNGLQNKTIAILGLTYKAGTPTLRRSLALEIIEDLKGEGAIIRAHDPMASAEEAKSRGILFFSEPYEAVNGSAAAVLITDWPEYEALDFTRLRSGMQNPAIFFDTKNFLSEKAEELKSMGFHYVGIGR